MVMDAVLLTFPPVAVIVPDLELDTTGARNEVSARLAPAGTTIEEGTGSRAVSELRS